MSETILQTIENDVNGACAYFIKKLEEGETWFISVFDPALLTATSILTVLDPAALASINAVGNAYVSAKKTVNDVISGLTTLDGATANNANITPDTIGTLISSGQVTLKQIEADALAVATAIAPIMPSIIRVANVVTSTVKSL